MCSDGTKKFGWRWSPSWVTRLDSRWGKSIKIMVPRLKRRPEWMNSIRCFNNTQCFNNTRRVECLGHWRVSSWITLRRPSWRRLNVSHLLSCGNFPGWSTTLGSWILRRRYRGRCIRVRVRVWFQIQRTLKLIWMIMNRLFWEGRLRRLESTYHLSGWWRILKELSKERLWTPNNSLVREGKSGSSSRELQWSMYLVILRHGRTRLNQVVFLDWTRFRIRSNLSGRRSSCLRAPRHLVRTCPLRSGESRFLYTVSRLSWWRLSVRTESWS